uniref:Tudor domain-containing protein n=1 Tax=Oryzias latipes TaxID=8090 RepID=H2MIJ3_ORYLA
MTDSNMAVLQSSKSGISIRSLQAEYRSLCGESLPLKRLGYQTLEDYLKSIPSVVRLDHRMGELMCFARVCDETAHIAELVARQKSSKKPARSWTANSGRRVKPPDPYLPNGVPRFSLKQPSCRPSAGSSSSSSKPSKFHDGSRNSSASGFYRLFKCLSTSKLRLLFSWIVLPWDEQLQPCLMSLQSSPYVAAEVQKNMRQLLKKYSNGLWMSKLSEVYREMFHQELHPQALTDLEKWTHICFVSCHFSVCDFWEKMCSFVNLKSRTYATSFLSGGTNESLEAAHDVDCVGPCLWSPANTGGCSIFNLKFCLPRLKSFFFFFLQSLPFMSSQLEKAASENRADRVIYPLLLSQLKTLNNPVFGSNRQRWFHVRLCFLKVNVLYQDVCVSNVCADGTLYCRLPSPGAFRLTRMLEEIASGISQVRSCSLLVSQPFIGKFCLARFRGQWARAEITNMFGDMMMEVLFIDFAVPVTVELAGLREIPPPFLKDFGFIPPQAVKCRLAEVDAPGFSHGFTVTPLITTDVIQILKLEESKGDRVAYIHLFVGGDGLEQNSINHQLVQLFQRALSSRGGNLLDAGMSDSTRKSPKRTSLHPQPGQNMDVFVVVACHPGYFVVQPWRDLDHLETLMRRMSLFYHQREAGGTVTHAQTGDVCAAKINEWYRVQVKRVLANGFVSVYELDYGQLELVQKSLIQPLVEQFRQLPFQAVPAQLAGVTQHQWSEAASMLFRNRVERRALVAQVESVQDVLEVKGEPWRRKLTVYLVDTTLEDEDLWIHCFMADIE